MADRYLLEDGSGFYLMEDGVSYYIMEDVAVVDPDEAATIQLGAVTVFGLGQAQVTQVT